MIGNRHYIVTVDNCMYHLKSDDDVVMLTSHNLSIVLQYASALVKGGHTVDYDDAVKNELDMGVV